MPLFLVEWSNTKSPPTSNDVEMLQKLVNKYRDVSRGQASLKVQALFL